MAGDWIKFEHSTPDKPEVFRMSTILNIDPDAVIGKLARFWCWCDQQTIDGNSLGIDETVIDRVTHQPGFSAALREVAWLQARSGSLAIPHFDRHNGHSAKARALAARKKAVQRDKGKMSPRMSPENGDKTGTTSSLLSSHSSLPIIGEEIPLPNALLTEAFKAKWAEWLEYRAQRRLPKLAPMSIKSQWVALADAGHDVAIAAIDMAIRNNWQGVFPERVARSQPPATRLSPTR